MIFIFLVAVPCVLGIFSSVTVALFFYKVIIRIEYFDFIHILAVFLILGIGADDVFVVWDAWAQSKLHHTDRLVRFETTLSRSAEVSYHICIKGTYCVLWMRFCFWHRLYSTLR